MPPATEPQTQKVTPVVRSAQVTCMFFGVALLVWGLAPTVIQHMVSGHAPPPEVLASASLTLLLGGAYLTLGTLIARGLNWPLWTTLFLSIAFMIATVVFAALVESGHFSAFALLLPAATGSTSFLALETRRQARARQTPTAAP